MNTVNVSVELLANIEKELYRNMGIVDVMDVETDLLNLIKQVKLQTMATARPTYSFVYADSIDFKCGNIIASALRGADRYALIVSSLGIGIDELLSSYQRDDMAKAFIADLVASELVENLSRKAIEDIEATLKPEEHISNAYSPGYCGWLLKEQRKLFAYFPDAPSGVTLNDSFLMTPIKSISAVVAIGSRIEKKPYGCQICTKVDCYKKRINL